MYPLKTSPTTSLTDSCAPNPSFPRSLDGRPSCARDADSSTSSPPFVVVVVVARAPPSSLDRARDHSARASMSAVWGAGVIGVHRSVGPHTTPPFGAKPSR